MRPSSISFSINGEQHTVDPNTPGISSELMLVDYIRDVAHLKGTKVMCREGGCGACVVTVKAENPATGQQVIKSLNSCMTPVFSCQGMDISTVEDLGNGSVGYHQIQKRMSGFHATQCGFCSPGFVMSMNSLLKSKPNLTVEDVDKNFDGNICRCTGYRPILDACKSFAVDAPDDIKRRCADIEDCASCPCPMRQEAKAEQKTNVSLSLANGKEWTTATDLWAIFQAVQKYSVDGKKYRFVAGNTSTGVYKNDGPFDAYIEVNGVPELKEMKVTNDGMALGAGTTLSAAIEFLNKNSSSPGFEFGAQVAQHLERVANVPVRNNGTIAGNLMIKHNHNDFPSDVFVLLTALDAKLNILSGVQESKNVDMEGFLKEDMKGKLIVSIDIPKRGGNYHFRSFKITRRYQNAHAYVNAGFLLNIVDGKIVEKPRIVYGGINPTFTRARATEDFLEKNPNISDANVLKAAVDILGKEVNPDFHLPEATPEYRKTLTETLLYKTILEIFKEKVTPRLRSGGPNIPREISRGEQVYDESKSESVLYKSMPKVEGAWQFSGEAEYVPDIPKRADELFGYFVQSKVGKGILRKIDASDALKMPGVIRFVSAKDIKGPNNYMAVFMMPTVKPEPVFVGEGENIEFHGQAIGLLLAKSRAEAFAAVSKIKVEYAEVEKPMVDVIEAVEKAKASGTLAKTTLATLSTNSDESIEIKHIIKGELQTGSQYHYYMETQSCVCVPKEDGMDIFSATQWMDSVQMNLASVLDVSANTINVQVKRLGGGFGGKGMPPTQIACACAVAAQVTRKPVRVILDLETNMTLIGKRFPYIMTYEAGFDEKGKIGSLKSDLICDTGFAPNWPTCIVAQMHMQNVYQANGWSVSPAFVTTNTPANTATRAPGSVQGVALIECIMEHISHKLNKDPLEIRRVNYIKKGDPMLPTLMGGPTNFNDENLIPRMIDELKESGELESRVKNVEVFNKENRWKKRGISTVPVRYGIGYDWGMNVASMIAIYHYDGTVAITHGGIEMGQGINTKVIQAVSNCLNIPADKIKVKAANNFVAANGAVTGGSIASELVCHSAIKACEILKARLKPFLEKMESPNWNKLIEEANKAKIDLTASYLPQQSDGLKGYNVWAVACSEVEIDVLTGEYKIVRTDLIEDAGKSLNPGIDIGQIEGAYIFGQGLWTTERIVHSPENGELLTARTWDYKPPETKDLPEFFKITLLKNAPNPNGVLRSKATGEPIADGSVAIFFALRSAIAAARADKGVMDWFRIDGPLTPEDVLRHCMTSKEDFAF